MRQYACAFSVRIIFPDRHWVPGFIGLIGRFNGVPVGQKMEIRAIFRQRRLVPVVGRAVSRPFHSSIVSSGATLWD